MRLLLQIQAIAGNAVPNEVAVIVSRVTGIPKSRIYGYITFYAMFDNKPRGKYIIRICKRSAPCLSAAPKAWWTRSPRNSTLNRARPQKISSLPLSFVNASA